MNKIQRVSRFLRVIFQIAFIVFPLTLIMFWSFAQYFINQHPTMISFIPDSVKILHQITITEAIEGFIVSLLPTAVFLTILYFLIKLFKLYEQGKIFTLQNVKYIKNIGITMLIGQLVSFINEGLLGVVLTIHNPPGHRMASVTFGTYDAYNVITAIMVIVISWIMAEGCKLQEEQKYTV